MMGAGTAARPLVSTPGRPMIEVDALIELLERRGAFYIAKGEAITGWRATVHTPEDVAQSVLMMRAYD